jgi:hypothetical protein
MTVFKTIPQLGFLVLGLMLFASGCVFVARGGSGAPRSQERYQEGYQEGYYDRDHHRWYHERGWQNCGEHDEHCRD